MSMDAQLGGLQSLAVNEDQLLAFSARQCDQYLGSLDFELVENLLDVATYRQV